MLLDLSRLATVGNKHLAALQAVGFDTNLLATAAALSDELSKVLADARKETTANSAAIDLRNRAYTYCEEAVSEVRECGKFVFRNNPEKRVHYFKTPSRSSVAKPVATGLAKAS